jgi:RND family efflux transporter MFP subunit
LTQAQGSLAQAKANLQRVLAGSSNEDIAVAQVTLDNAKASLDSTKSQQQVLVNNAYQALLNSGLAATPNGSNTGSETATISGTYTGSNQGVYKIALYSTGGGTRFQVSGLEVTDGLVSTVPQPLGSKGLSIQFSTTNIPVNDSWTVNIPNNQSSVYVANYNAYQAALQNQSATMVAAQNAVDSAQAALDLKKAQARPADVDAAQAAVLSAQGQVQAAQANVEDTIVRAPSNGTITSVDIKTGEQAAPSKEVIVLQDVGNLHIEANVSEANIASVQPGQTVDVTFDALGPDRHFQANVQTVNPASTVVSGVVNYLVKASLANISDIKPGMTANMTVLVGQKSQVLTVPQSAVISDGSGNKQIRLVDDSNKKTYHLITVQTGMEADGGLVEIISGLQQGQGIVTYVKQ